MIRNEQTAADQAAEQADNLLASFRQTAEDYASSDEQPTAPISATDVALLAVAEQLRALRLGMTAAIEHGARTVSRR